MKLNIILKPLVTEKSLSGGKENSYTFEVNRRATKDQIRTAINEIFKANPIKVRTMMSPAKPKRAGRKRLAIKTQATKKAVVVLAKGQKIEVLESTGN